MRCGSKGMARRGDGGPRQTTMGRALVERWPSVTRRCSMSGEPGLPERLAGQARSTGERVAIDDPRQRNEATNAAMRWSRADHPAGRYLGLAWSGRYAALGLLDDADEPRLVVTVWDPDGSLCRRLDFQRHDVELALIELESQGDLPAVLLHPLVTDFV